MPTALQQLVADILRRPDIKRAVKQQKRRDSKRERTTLPAAEQPFVQRPLERYAVKGTWDAGDIEPFLAPPRSSLNPAHAQRYAIGYGDDLVILDGEEL